MKCFEFTLYLNETAEDDEKLDWMADRLYDYCSDGLVCAYQLQSAYIVF